MSEGRVRRQLESGRLVMRSAERKHLQWMNSQLGEFAIGEFTRGASAMGEFRDG